MGINARPRGHIRENEEEKVGKSHMTRKKKILLLSDHAMCTSGVGVQSRHLMNGLVEKGEWTVRQFGAAIKHENYDTVQVNEDFYIKPIDGFGTKELLRITLATEKPDVLMIFTDPRFFIWLFEMEDEIHQICPIAWWHVWDNAPFPIFNDSLYSATDLINCHSHMTYKLIHERYPDKTNFIPHANPPSIFYPLPKNEVSKFKSQLLGDDKKDWFIAEWINRNARRKRPNDLLHAWSLFLDKLESKHGNRDAMLILHTDPYDGEGPALKHTVEYFGITDNVTFSTERVDFDKMNVLHNMSDVCLNISYAEGFGLPTLEAMQTGTPIIALKTGGLTRQVVDHRDGSENGVALPVEYRSLVGSQTVPYIFEDYCSTDTVANALLKMYELSPHEKEELSIKVRDYANSEFPFHRTVDAWHNTLNNLIDNWKDEKENRWTLTCF